MKPLPYPDNQHLEAAEGWLELGNPLASAEKLNPTASTPAWTYIASLPQPLFNFPAVFNRTNYIYIFGGLTNPAAGGEIASVLRYSISGNSWSSLAPMPVAVAGSAATLGPDGSIYVVGGTSGGISTNLVQVYNPASNSWTLSTPLPEGLSLTALGVDSLNRLLVMGGVDTNGNDVADVWRTQPFGVPDSPPVFTNFPATGDVYQGPYASSINAVGNPPPVYSLVSGPPGMKVDYYSGAISWTPQGLGQIGSNPVVIAATNYAGATNWSFSIVIPNPPPSIPTNFQEISFNDNSGTISWSPQDPSVGPVTYSIAIPHPYHSPKGSGGGVTYGTVFTGITTNVVTFGLSPSSSATYALSVTASNGATTGYSYSTWFTVTSSGPQGPANLWVTALTSSSISLQWPPSPGPDVYPFYSPIVSYAVMERAGSPPTNFPVLQNLTVTNATITGLTPGNTYTWYVAGVDSQGYYSPLTSASVSFIQPIPKPAVLAGLGGLPNGGFQFAITPVALTPMGGLTTLVQATTNISDPNSWMTIATNPPASATFNFIDTNSGQFSSRYYRVVAP